MLLRVKKQHTEEVCRVQTCIDAARRCHEIHNIHHAAPGHQASTVVRCVVLLPQIHSPSFSIYYSRLHLHAPHDCCRDARRITLRQDQAEFLDVQLLLEFPPCFQTGETETYTQRVHVPTGRKLSVASRSDRTPTDQSLPRCRGILAALWATIAPAQDTLAATEVPLRGALLEYRDPRPLS